MSTASTFAPRSGRGPWRYRDVGPAGREYRALHDIEADVRAAQRSMVGWGGLLRVPVWFLISGMLRVTVSSAHGRAATAFGRAERKSPSPAYERGAWLRTVPTAYGWTSVVQVPPPFLRMAVCGEPVLSRILVPAVSLSFQFATRLAGAFVSSVR
jgi:hypothetical protein